MFKVFSRLTLVCASAFTVPFLLGTASAGPLDPGSKLCLRPFVIPIDAEEGDERRSNIEEKLIQGLRGVSLSVANPQEVDDLIKRVEIESGGFINPFTGRRDEARFRSYRDQLASALRDELGCDGQLLAQVVLVRARFGGGVASWDGTKFNIFSNARMIMGALGGAYESGWVSALSLWLKVMDLDGNELAVRTAGIETLVNYAILRDKDLLPEDRWLTDEPKISAAIQSALGYNGLDFRRLAEKEEARLAADGK